MIDTDFRRGVTLAAATLALAAGLPACGSGDDGEDSSAAKAPSSETRDAAATSDTSAPTGTVKEQIAALVKATEAAYQAGDGDTYCSNLTETGQREVADYARGVGQDPSCPEFIESASRKIRELGITQKPSRIVSVRANGTRATARISIDRKPPRPTKFANVDGQWKFVTAGFTQPLR
jgi:hypothetical protein